MQRVPLSGFGPVRNTHEEGACLLRMLEVRFQLGERDGAYRGCLGFLLGHLCPRLVRAAGNKNGIPARAMAASRSESNRPFSGTGERVKRLPVIQSKVDGSHSRPLWSPVEQSTESVRA